jgi:hypothetical protein
MGHTTVRHKMLRFELLWAGGRTVVQYRDCGISPERPGHGRSNLASVLFAVLASGCGGATADRVRWSRERRAERSLRVERRGRGTVGLRAADLRAGFGGAVGERAREKGS